MSELVTGPVGRVNPTARTSHSAPLLPFPLFLPLPSHDSLSLSPFIQHPPLLLFPPSTPQSPTSGTFRRCPSWIWLSYSSGRFFFFSFASCTCLSPPFLNPTQPYTTCHLPGSPSDHLSFLPLAWLRVPLHFFSFYRHQASLVSFF